MFTSTGVMRRTISGRMRMARVWVSAAADGTATGGIPILGEARPVGGIVASGTIPRQLRDVCLPGIGVISSARDVKVHVLADVEGKQVNTCRVRESPSHQGIDHRKRLDRLRWIKVIALLFVGKVQAGTDDGDSPDAVRFESGLDVPEMLVEQKVGQRFVSSEIPRSLKSWKRVSSFF